MWRGVSSPGMSQGVMSVKLLGIVVMAAALSAPLVAETDPVSGGAGWVGAGLLGLVLSWLLLKHLPDKDKQIERLIDGKDQAMVAVQNMFSSEQKQARELFASTLDKLVAEQHIDRESRDVKYRDLVVLVGKHHDEMVDRHDKSFEYIRTIKHDLASLVQTEANKRAAEQFKAISKAQGGEGREGSPSRDERVTKAPRSGKGGD